MEYSIKLADQFLDEFEDYFIYHGNFLSTTLRYKIILS